MLFLNCALKQLIQLQINQMAQAEQSLFLEQAQCSQTQEPVKQRKKQTDANNGKDLWEISWEEIGDGFYLNLLCIVN